MVSIYLYSDYYTNKLYKFRRGPQKPGRPVSVFVPLGKFLPEALSMTSYNLSCWNKSLVLFCMYYCSLYDFKILSVKTKFPLCWPSFG